MAEGLQALRREILVANAEDLEKGRAVLHLGDALLDRLWSTKSGWTR